MYRYIRGSQKGYKSHRDNYRLHGITSSRFRLSSLSKYHIFFHETNHILLYAIFILHNNKSSTITNMPAEKSI